jgi:DNA-binding NtrC family response regulator
MPNPVKPKILIVDDDKALLTALKQICESLACDVRIAENGEAALKMIDEQEFTLVLTDIRMPKMDGVALLETIEKKGLDLPVIVMSGFSDYTGEDIDARNGVVLLEKPFSLKQIRETIEKFVVLLPKTGTSR